MLDVRRDVETCFAAARDKGLRIRYACDSHQHNDHLSGICGSGYRSSVAASVIPARGHEPVAHVLGGMTGWQAEGFETTDTPNA